MHSFYDFDPILVYNPLVKEYLYLPPITNYNWVSQLVQKIPQTVVALGFGFNPTTKEYQVIRVHYPDLELGHVESYTLGRGGGWESLGTTTHRLQTDPHPGVLVNGSIHWLTHVDSSFGFNQESTIVRFDMSAKAFTVVPLPTDGALRYGEEYVSTDINESGGVLCMFQKNIAEEEMQLWILRGASWVRKVVTMRLWLYSLFEPCSLQKNDEQVLVWCTSEGYFAHEELNCFDTHEDDEEYDFLSDEPVRLMTKRGYRKSAVFAHINSFVSLKSFGEEHVKTLRGVQEIPDPY